VSRPPDWPERLLAALAAARDRPFRWGEHDCCLFAADLIEAVTGVDPAAAFRPVRPRGEPGAVDGRRYRTAQGALALLRLHAWVDEIAAGARRRSAPPEEPRPVEAALARAAAEQGWPETAPALAGRGDLAYVRDRDTPGFDGLAAVCVAPGQLACLGLEGVVLLPASRAARAWRVG